MNTAVLSAVAAAAGSKPGWPGPGPGPGPGPCRPCPGVAARIPDPPSAEGASRSTGMFRQWCLASQELAAKVVGNLKLGPRSIGLTGLRLPCNAGTAGTARVWWPQGDSGNLPAARDMPWVSNFGPATSGRQAPGAAPEQQLRCKASSSSHCQGSPASVVHPVWALLIGSLAQCVRLLWLLPT